jgi:hypothetical protein
MKYLIPVITAGGCNYLGSLSALGHNYMGYIAAAPLLIFAATIAFVMARL